jgi:AcrR family transcriptional regulator
MTGKSVLHPGMAEKGTKRESRRRHIHEALLAAAVARISASGPGRVTVDDIALAAGVAKGTFYNHFEDKEAVLRAVARSVRLEAQRAVRAAITAAADPADRVARALSVFMAMPRRAPASARILTQVFAGMSRPDAALNQPLRETIELGFAEGHFTGISHAAAIAFVISTARTGMSLLLERSGDREAGRELGVDLVIACLRGLGVGSDRAMVLARQAAADA